MRIYLSYGVKQDEESAYINTAMGAFIEVILGEMYRWSGSW